MALSYDIDLIVRLWERKPGSTNRTPTAQRSVLVLLSVAPHDSGKT